MRHVLDIQEDELTVLTDLPTDISVSPDGFLDFNRSCNVVVQRLSKRLVLPQAQTRLSIRAVFGGSRSFETTNGGYTIDDPRYLILNQGQYTRSNLVSTTPVECLNVTFEPDYASTLLTELATPADELIACPDSRRTIQPFELASGPHRHDGRVSSHFHALRKACHRETATTGWLEDRLHNLLVDMVSVHRKIVAEIESIEAVKLSTRIELHLRLNVARDFIEANYYRHFTPDDIARQACLSSFHLLRLYKQVFGATPHQYLTNVRLNRARRLLTKTHLTVTEICTLIGFESLGSFSWLFRKRFGVPPTAFRASGDADSLPL